MDLSIVIVNWNSGDLLRQCLHSLAGAHLSAGDRIESVVVVDNASTDDSADGLDAGALPLQILRNAENRGFAAACNQGAAIGRSEFLLFLNPDTRLFESSLRVPMEYLSDPRNANVGIVGIQLLDDDGAVARTCARFPRVRQFAAHALGIDRLVPTLDHFMSEWDHQSTRQVDQVIGAFFMTRRSLFDALSGFDERFFVYLEEVDYSRRALDRGSISVYLATASAYHMGGGSSRKVKALRLFYVLRSRLQYGAKHFGPWRQASLWIVTMVVEPFARVLQLLVSRRGDEARDVLSAYRMLVADRFGRGGRRA